MRLSGLRFTIRVYIYAVAVVAIALLLPRLSADEWSIFATSASLAALGIAVLGVRFHRERVRAFCVGFAIAGWAYFLYFTSPTLARGAGEPYRRITQSVLTLPVGAAGGFAASMSYFHSSRLMSGRCLHCFGERGEQPSQIIQPPE